jgi:hypothetical protein
LVTKAKPRNDTGDLPLAVSPERVMREFDVGRTSVKELEDQGLLELLPLGSLRLKRYTRASVLALAQAKLPGASVAAEQAREVEAGQETAV